MSGPSTDNQINSVLIVGGGTAGWLAACHLAKKLRPGDPDGIRVTLVESPDIPTIGVGEGTVPAMRQSLQYLGISETDFIRECEATFKQSIRFDGWMRNPEHSYHHVFDYPRRDSLDLTPYWLLNRQNKSYADSVGIQSSLCDAGLGPKQMTEPEYSGISNYAYHLDAGKFSELLTRHATTQLGVEHRQANISAVQLNASGDIDYLETDRLGELRADFYVDCTGFKSLLLGSAMGVEFVDRSDVLLADHALAVQVPYASPDSPIPCQTIATARSAGWIWDIGLVSRRGTGYVYSSQHIDHDKAELELRDYLRTSIGDAADEVSCRRIPMQVGYRERFWSRNCAAIGLSQGFVEPLEATGLLMFDATARMLAEQFPASRDVMPLLSERFNKRVRFTWERVIDFIKLHYCVSDRDDSSFWQANRDPATIPESLQENLQLWRHQPPSEYDFPSKLEIFNLENYLYVLYGMDYPTDIAPLAYRYPHQQIATSAVESSAALAEQAKQLLLPHRELIQKIHRYGLQKI
ncbi:MAG: tryptophan halogenase family protein [Halioglobus sp.]